MIAKLHKSINSIVLVVCDSNLVGKKLEERELQLDLSSDFYSGKEESDEKIRLLMNASSIMNFVGKKSVNLAINEGVVDKKNVMKIKGIPHAQCVRL